MLKKNIIPIVICFLFFTAYATLSIVKHMHFLTGYDLAIVDQAVWQYSQLKSPITTVQAYPFTSLLTDHVEIIYILLSPSYLIYNNALTLIVLQALFVSLSGIPVYLLARHKKLPIFLSLALVISYLSFYGIQNALWSDVHSVVFGAAFLPWFIYFLYKNNKIGLFISLLLAIVSKEDVGLLTFAISFVYFIVTRAKVALITMLISVLYVGSIFIIYFPHFTEDGYRYASSHGLFYDIKLSYLHDTSEKMQVYFYSIAWFGFLPFLTPLYLLPAIADIAHYFVFGHAVVTSAQGLFMHYRSTLAILLVWPTIIVLGKFLSSKYKKYVNPQILAVYVVICAVIFQYALHAPLSYLTKKWFWSKPQAVDNIEHIIRYLPTDASVVSQSNITPHIAHRDNTFILWPNTKDFSQNSPCGKKNCRWFRWVGNPTYMVVDTSSDWDIRHFLANKEDFLSGLENMEKAGVIKEYQQKGNAVIYKILKQP